jgi:hypothetical protein
MGRYRMAHWSDCFEPVPNPTFDMCSRKYAAAIVLGLWVPLLPGVVGYANPVSGHHILWQVAFGTMRVEGLIGTTQRGRSVLDIESRRPTRAGRWWRGDGPRRLTILPVTDGSDYAFPHSAQDESRRLELFEQPRSFDQATHRTPRDR